MRRRLLAACAALLIVPAAAGPAHAAAPASDPCSTEPDTATLAATTTRLGVVDLNFFGASGAPVTFYECIGERAVTLDTKSSAPGSVTILYRATSWHCDPLARRFAATAPLADGSVARGTSSVRTRSCASRFELTVPRRVPRGGAAVVRIRDRWRVGGVRTKLCIARPGGRLACRSVVFRGAVKLATRRFEMPRRGLWRVELRVLSHSTRATIAVGVRAAKRKARPPTLLATGDSTMDGMDSFLADQLGDELDVVSTVKLGLAISRSDAFQPLAVQEVERLQPAATVVSVGANEGWPMRGAGGALHECCDAQWVDEYARRVRRTMVTFGRRVFWCTIVAPKDPRRVPIIAATNAGIVRAAQGLADVHVVRMDLLFTPSGYRETIRYGGRDVDVRAADGVHLSVAGTEIAAGEVVKALRATP